VRPDAIHRDIQFGLDRLPFAGHLPRHRHMNAYATIVLAGAFEQFSYAGRLKLQPGDVLINPTFDCHSNRMISPGTTLIRLPWRYEATFGGVYRNLSIGAIESAAARDAVEATGLLEEQLIGKTHAPFPVQECSDKLAIDLGVNPGLRISGWAARQGLTREYAWRCFIRTFGVAPAQFRWELKARAALLKIASSNDSLSRIAADSGFADQPHMTRAIRLLTGGSPAQWRGTHLFETNAATSARSFIRPRHPGRSAGN
jgi:AraC-like DNA-binding protein